MQKIKVNEKDYLIPISWNEVTYKQAVDVIVNVNDKCKQLSALTGISENEINDMVDKDAAILFNIISFTENLEVFDSMDVLDEFKDFDFGSIKYSDAEMCRKLLNSDSVGFIAVIEIIKHLKQIDISERPFLEVIGTANFFLSKSISSTIITASLTKVRKLMNNYKLAASDYKALAALEHTLKLQS